MLTMAIVPLVGCGVAVLAALLIHHNAAARRQDAQTHVDQEMQEKLKQAKALDQRAAVEILGGADVDRSIDDLTKARSRIHTIPSDSPWLWEADDLAKWAKAQLVLLVARINSRARLSALAVLVSVVLAVVGIDAVLYSNLSQSAAVLSPQTPTNSNVLPSSSSIPAADGPPPASDSPSPTTTP